MACSNCGYTNAPGERVCRSCGRRLAAVGVSQAAQRSPRRYQAVPIEPREAPPGRESARARRGGGRPAGGGGRQAMALAAALLALLLLAGGATAMLLSGRDAARSRDPANAAEGSAPPPAASRKPALALTMAPVSPTPTAPRASGPPGAAAGPVDCSASSVPTAWLNLTRDERRQRIPVRQIWCMHDVIVVPYFGYGTIRLLVDGRPVAEVVHRESTAQAEYAFELSPPLSAGNRSEVVYRFSCDVEDCAAAIQLSYQQLPAP